MTISTFKISKYVLYFIGIYFLIHLTAGMYIATEHQAYFLHHDGAEYLELAESFAEHFSYISKEARYYETPRSFPLPEPFRIQIFSVLAALPVFLGFTPVIAAALTCAILSTLAVYLVFLTARRITGSENAAYFSVLIFTFHPLLLQYSFQFCCEILCCVFLLLFFLFYPEPDSWKKYILLAVFLMGASYSRVSTFLYFPLIGIWILICTLRTIRNTSWECKIATLSVIAIFPLTACLLASPAAIRNYIHFGKPSIAGFESGFGFFHGNNRYMLKAYQAKDGKEYLEMEDKNWELTFGTVRNLPEEYAGHPEKQSRYMLKFAFRELADMSFREKLFLFASKCIHFIQPNPKAAGLHHPLLYWGLTFSISLLYLTGIAGGILLWKNKPDAGSSIIALYLLGVCGILTGTIFLVNMRYRIPYIDLPLILLAGYPLQFFWKKDSVTRKIILHKIIAIKGSGFRHLFRFHGKIKYGHEGRRERNKPD